MDWYQPHCNRLEKEIRMNVVLTPKQVTRLFAMTAASLILVHLIGQFARFFLGIDTDNLVTKFLLQEFHLSLEENVPTYYSGMALLFCAVLLAFIAGVKKQGGMSYATHWAVLAAIFLYLSVDEMSEWHEVLEIPVRAVLNTSGLFYFGWVIPFGFLLVVFLIAYARFVLYHLPNRTRVLFILAGVIFLSGALGVEMLGGRYAELYGYQNLTMVLYQTVEESLEMTGILVFIYALTSYIASELNDVRLSIAPGGEKL